MKIARTIYGISICVLSLIHTTSAQTYTGPIQQPDDGYGSIGPYTLDVIAFENPYYVGEDIRIYYPKGLSKAVPTIFYSHGYGGFNPIHAIGLFNFIAKKGYAIVFVPYQTEGVTVLDRYENLREGFRQAARNYPEIVDTTQVGFMGHSFGGGATISISYKCFTENNWGSKGRFIYPSAPWYSFGISQEILETFPNDTKMIMEVYQDDIANDHRIAADIFQNINIPSDQKDFIKVYSSTYQLYDYIADHSLPTTYKAYDALDHYAYYRLIDAMCDYVFNNNPEAKEVALGNGGIEQVEMPVGLKSLEQSDNPIIELPESKYEFPCSSLANPRRLYCGIISNDTNIEYQSIALKIFPNPSYDEIHLNFSIDTTVNIRFFDVLGNFVFETDKYETIDISGWKRGLYFAKVYYQGQEYSKRFLKL